MLILAVLAASAFDPTHAAWQRVLDQHLHDGWVDYAGLRAKPADLDAWLVEVANAPAATLSAADRTAFWIDAYNGLTVDLIADTWPIASIRDLDGGKVWDTRRFRVGGATVTLNELEGRLRAQGDPRVHAALNCASKGCPPLAPRAFLGATLESQLDEAARRWAATMPLRGNVLALNSIFDWYSADFTPKYGRAAFDVPGLEGAQEAAVNFLARHAPDRADALRRGGYTVTWATYDWAVNADSGR